MMKIAKNDLDLNFLWVSVRESNQRAVSCYQRGGFKIVRKVPVYKADGSYQMWVHMEKLI
jgi:ribosomal protein S18 acetylase RimI-like enzyme